MTALRWILGIIAFAMGGGFVFLVIISTAFRKLFGARPSGPPTLLLPILALGVLLAAIVFPGCEPLLHIAAATAVGLVGLCIWQIVAQTARILWLALVYLAAWFIFYWLAAWHAAIPS